MSGPAQDFSARRLRLGLEPSACGRGLGAALSEAGEVGDDLHMLDLGAGYGCVAQELLALGIRRFVGVDIYDEAAEAAERDRPGLYADYVVGDLTNLDDEGRNTLEPSKYLKVCAPVRIPVHLLRAGRLHPPSLWDNLDD